MNFNYILSTGDSTITGSQLGFLQRNRKSYIVDYQTIVSRGYPFSLNKDGSKRLEASALDFDVVTGDHSSLLSFNSQTLLEGEEQVNQGERFSYYSLDSGEYLVDTVSGSDVFHFCNDLDVTDEDIINYDKRDFATGILIYSTTNPLDNDALRVKVHSAYSNAATERDFWTNYDVFLNGQKLKYTEDSIAEFTGVEVPAYGTTGNLFAIPKKDRINEFYSDEPDVFGSGFIEHQLDFYLNGMEQSLDDILQLNTGVSRMVETGVEVFVGTINLLTQETYNL
jgi:hypothetical protein